MRSPSPRCLPNTITFSRFAASQDVDAGAIGDASAYTQVIGNNVACSVQLQSSVEEDSTQNRPTIVNSWSVLLPQDYGLRLKDQAVFVLDGVTHTTYVTGYVNYAGRDSTWEAIVIERL